MLIFFFVFVVQEKAAELSKELADLEEHLKRVKKGLAPLKREKDEEGEEKPAFPEDEDKIVAMIDRLKERKEKHDLKMRDKADNAEVALGTSKINYNDRKEREKK